MRLAPPPCPALPHCMPWPAMPRPGPQVRQSQAAWAAQGVDASVSGSSFLQQVGYREYAR